MAFLNEYYMQQVNFQCSDSSKFFMSIFIANISLLNRLSSWEQRYDAGYISNRGCDC